MLLFREAVSVNLFSMRGIGRWLYYWSNKTAIYLLTRDSRL